MNSRRTILSKKSLVRLHVYFPLCVFQRQKDIRLCVYMRAINKSIFCERHITPTITELIANINGSTMFSKLEPNQGYHQLELAPESGHLTTLSTHIGLRRYKRLKFGIPCAASEVFKRHHITVPTWVARCFKYQ